MPYDPLDRSELEVCFENLFRERFGKAACQVLQPQHLVQINGKTYRIDYAYFDNDRQYAIELDGYEKIEKATAPALAFQALLDRQNDLVEAGFLPIRLTWADVVTNNGDGAIARLEKVFRAVSFRNWKQSGGAWLLTLPEGGKRHGL